MKNGRQHGDAKNTWGSALYLHVRTRPTYINGTGISLLKVSERQYFPVVMGFITTIKMTYNL
jgi:hypothetical protein